jgi:alkanesulfonate monooxygenase SsuD/methylene tetrahydromethanopterin reductase-like flavin-dependent oxidoreductase (luciferase family)
VQLGIHLPTFKVPDGTPGIAPELVRVGEAAEAAGATWLSVMDHYFQMDGMAPAEDPMLEGYTTLGFLAAHTSTVRLGLLVTGVTYRHPGLLAKAVSTLDVLSGGRADLGIGAAWYEREHLGLGVPFPPTAERFERLEEALQICLQMWDPDNNGPYEGRHYQLAETLCSPAPISRATAAVTASAVASCVSSFVGSNPRLAASFCMSSASNSQAMSVPSHPS